MAFIIIFTLGYLVGGASAVFLLGLTVAARRCDHGQAAPPPAEKRA